MKFLLDEHINPAVASGLENRGHEATTVVDEGLTSLEDGRILNYAFENGYAVVTNDDDFLTLLDVEDHKGIIFVTRQEMRVSNIISGIVKKISGLEDLDNTVLYV